MTFTHRAPDLRAEIERLGPWFHNLHLPGGVETAPDHWLGDFPRCLWAQVESLLPERLDGWRALDVGCNAGGHAFELARRGARVLGVDVDERYLAQARWAAGVLGLAQQVELRALDVYDLHRLEGSFDLVLFMGVLYHLRHPLLGLDLVREKVGRLLLVQSMTVPRPASPATPEDVPYPQRERLAEPQWPSMAFVEQRFAGDPTNWWVPDPGCLQALLRACGLRVIGQRGDEICLCVPGELPAGARRELAAAIGARRAGRVA